MGDNFKENEELITSEDFYSISECHNPDISPDGKKVVYVLQKPDKINNDYNRSIWLIDLDTGERRKLTMGGIKGDFMPKFSPKGDDIAFLSSMSKEEKPQIYIISLKGGERTKFSNHKNGVISFNWSHSGEFIAFLSRVNKEEMKKESENSKEEEIDDIELLNLKKKEEKIKEKRRFDPRIIRRLVYKTETYFRDDRRFHIYIQKVGERQAHRITEGDYDFSDPIWTKDDRFILTSVNMTGDEDFSVRRDIVKIDIESKKIIPLVQDGNGNYSPKISPDGKKVAFLTFHKEKIWQQRTSIKIVSIEGGEVIDLTDRFDLDPESFQFSSDGKWIYFNAPDRGKYCIYRVSIDGKKLEKVVDERFFVEDFSISKETDRLVFQVSAPDVPRDIFMCEKDGSNLKRLTEVNKDFFNKKKISYPEEIVYKSFDDIEIQGWVMRPVNFKKDKKYPLIVEIHGGPHIMWGYSWWHEFQSMTSKGYVVFYCNPRGSAGYGRDFKGMIYRKWGDEDSQDILTGVKKLIDSGYIDEKRLFITGGSFGGFMTTWIISHNDMFKAAVAQRGVYNFLSLYGNSDAYLLIEWEFGTTPWRSPLFLWKRSPIAYVEQINTPLLIIHSLNDYRAGVATADELYACLKRLGKEVEMVLYPREGHELSRSGEPKHRVDRINRIINWFDKYNKT